MSEAKVCARCGAPVAVEGTVCAFCGAVGDHPRSLEEQKHALDAFHAALGAAMQQLDARTSEGRARRDRLIEDAFVPSFADLLVDEAMRCRQMFNAYSLQSRGPRARFEACVARLELLAVDDAHLGKKVEHLKEQLVAQQAREASTTRKGCLLGIVFVAIVVLVVWLAVRS